MDAWVANLVKLVNERVDEFLGYGFAFRLKPNETNPLVLIRSMANQVRHDIRLVMENGCALIFRPGQRVEFFRGYDFMLIKPGELAAVDAEIIGSLREFFPMDSERIGVGSF